MVMEDPDALELDDLDEPGIGIFEPGSLFETNMDWNNFVTVIFMVLLGWGTMFILTALIMIPLMGIIGLMGILTNPWALLILSVAELGFIIPVVYYVRNRNLPLRTIGLKNFTSLKDIGLGFIVGLLMLGTNLIISYIMSFYLPNISGDESLFGDAPPGEFNTIIWVSLWTISMFVIVGFSEEIVFRGFLQRRMEMFYRQRGTKNYKMTALIITSIIFSVFHLDIIGLGTRFILGLFLGYLAQRRKYSIVGPMIAHGVNNSAVIILGVLLP
jgi:membrane protease YdiL (CAAX protease family)